MNRIITLNDLRDELWTSLLRMGSPRVTPRAIEAAPRPTRRHRRHAHQGRCASLGYIRPCVPPCVSPCLHSAA